MKLKRFLTLSIAILLILALFAGCASKNVSENAAVQEGVSSQESTLEVSGESASALPSNQKLIRTLYLDAETKDIDPLLSSINQRITELGGYIEEREITNSSLYAQSDARTARLTVRIPAENLDQFVDHISGSSNITTNRETTENVTLQYIAVESRIQALETEQTRLLELLAQAETMDDLLLIEDRLTDVRTELEQVTSHMRALENQIHYGTVHLTLTQVRQYTEPKPEGFWDQLGTGFLDSLEGVGHFLLGLFFLLIVCLPYIVVLGGIAWLILFLRKRHKKKPKKETTP